MFSTAIPSFTVDLNLPERDRWQEVLTKMKQPALAVVKEAGHEFRHVPWIVRQAFAKIYNRKDGIYIDEIRSIADALGISTGTATVLNCAYELSHLYVPKLFGCTAGLRYLEGKGMVHIRTLDWPLPAMGDATCLFNFKKGSRQFTAVGVPGHVGVLSAMLPGAYSVTINWAPPKGWPNFEFGPMFFLRTVFETCNDFDSAYKMLRDTPLSTSVFFTICGVARGQGCIIERTKDSAVVKPLIDNVVVQANHHEAPQFVKNNAMINQLENVEFLAESGVRSEVLTKALKEYRAGDNIAALLDLKPVLNKETVQKMVLCPATGEINVWRSVAERK